MFKQRLKIVASNIGMVFLAILFIALLFGCIFLLEKFFHIFEFMDWLRTKKVIFGWIMFVGIVLWVLYYIWKFVYWLLIEPFRKEKL